MANLTQIKAEPNDKAMIKLTIATLTMLSHMISNEDANTTANYTTVTYLSSSDAVHYSNLSIIQ